MSRALGIVGLCFTLGGALILAWLDLTAKKRRSHSSTTDR